jgi:hypothetical protein
MEALQSDSGARKRWWATGGLAAALVIGAALRLVWAQDIEYKADEIWTFTKTQEVGRTEGFPWLGMPSSAAIPNPGMSVWVFLALGKIMGAEDPPTLARGVQLLNIAALVLLVGFIWLLVDPGEREAWLWAAALVAVNPFAILFQRKIWPPSVLPIFCLMFLAGWWRRERRGGAFAWGLVGVVMGQIHMSGYFFAAAFAGWVLLFDRQRVAWRSWLAGSCLGALPMIPWLATLLSRDGEESIHASRWTHVIEWKFWMRWVTEPLGLGLNYSLGDDLFDFLRYPVLGGWPTYLVAFIHVLLIVAGGTLLFGAAGRLWRDRGQGRDIWTGRSSPSAFAQNAALLGFGGLLTASTMLNQRHYLIITFPLMFLWLARLALARQESQPGSLPHGRALLGAVCVLQALLSFAFLGYIHVNQREIQGDYGAPYAAQPIGRTTNTSAPTAFTLTRNVSEARPR